jgi:NO-binding membrane sensor protein with MHYT domain
MAAAGAMLGAGIWATHFIGMLAFQSPLKHGFAFLPTTISALVVIGLGCAAFTLAGLRPTWRSLLIAGACVGLGAILMHFLGMRGLRIEAALSYRPIPVAATSLGAVVAGVAALRLAHRTSPSWLRGVAAFPMGAVIAGLHYTDAAATIITPRPAFAPPPQTDAAPMMATLVIAAMVFLSAVALLAAALDRGAARRAARGDASAVSTAPTAGADVIVIPNPSRQADADTIILAPDRNGRRPQDDVRSS